MRGPIGIEDRRRKKIDKEIKEAERVKVFSFWERFLDKEEKVLKIRPEEKEEIITRVSYFDTYQ